MRCWSAAEEGAPLANLITLVLTQKRTHDFTIFNVTTVAGTSAMPITLRTVTLILTHTLRFTIVAACFEISLKLIHKLKLISGFSYRNSWEVSELIMRKKKLILYFCSFCWCEYLEELEFSTSSIKSWIVKMLRVLRRLLWFPPEAFQSSMWWWNI